MTNFLKGVAIVIVGAVVGALVAVTVGGNSQPVGGIYNLVQNEFADGIKVGNSSYTPTTITLVKMGTCTLLADFSITASTTRNVDCAITGVISGDIVDLTLAASTTLASQYVVKSSLASTTNGYATAQLVNLTGGAAVPSATNGFGSSTRYKVWRTR